MQEVPAALVERFDLQAPWEVQAAQEEALPQGFVYLDEAAPGILWDARYATEDNFTGQVVPGYEANRIALSLAAVQGLIRAQAIAQEEGYQLLVWDGARPQRAVDWFVAWAQLPEDGRTREEHYPNLDKSQLMGEYVASRSGHSRGGSVDLTWLTLEGEAVDMGGSFDLMDPISHHGAKGISQTQADNRALLKQIMVQAGFEPYASEWWHYTLKDEPYPDTYFDFVITGSPAS